MSTDVLSADLGRVFSVARFNKGVPVKKRHHLVLAVAAVSLALAGCSGNDKGKAGVGEEAATELTSANFTKEIAAAQQKAKTSHIKIAADAFSAEGDVELGASAADTKIAMKFGTGAGTGDLDMRLIDQIFYINLGPMSQNKFARIDLTDPANPIGAQYGSLIEQFNPTKQMEQFDDAMTSMTKKGKPIELDGVEAQPYEVVLDTSKIEGLDKIGAGAELPEEMAYIVYVGPDNLPRRISTDLSGASVKVDYTKWGEPVDIKAPAKTEIADEDLMEKLGEPSP